MTPEYPEHEKLSEVSEFSQVAGEFLDWLSDEGIVLCRWQNAGDGEPEGYIRNYTPIKQLLAGFFEIDLEKIELEKKQMLQRMQERAKANE